MTPDEVIAYALEKPGAVLCYPFGPQPACVKVGGHITTQVYEAERVSLNRPGPIMTVKCMPESGVIYKELYPGDVSKGYYSPPSQQPYWITVMLRSKVPDDVQREMLDAAWDAVFFKLPKRVRSEILPNWQEYLP